jgi:hypothetical protein
MTRLALLALLAAAPALAAPADADHPSVGEEAASAARDAPDRAPAAAVTLSETLSEARSPWRPQVSLALPQPIQLGAERELDPRWRAYASAGYFAWPLSGGSRSVMIYGLEAGGRYHPWAGKFFLNAGVGYRRIAFSSDDISALKLEDEVLATGATIDLFTLYGSLKVGWDFPVSRTMSLGFDLGAQVAVMKWGRLVLRNDQTGQNSGNSSDLSADSSRAMRRVAGLLLPSVTLLRLSWSL